MVAKSSLQVAYELLLRTKAEVTFDEIWDYVCEQLNYTDEQKISKKARFYTNISLDGRFVLLGDSKWDLRSNLMFDKVHIDMQAVYADAEEKDIDEDDDDEEKVDDDIISESEDLEGDQKKIDLNN